MRHELATLRRTIGPEIHLETVAAVGLWSVLVDPSQLENAPANAGQREVGAVGHE